MIHVFIPVHTHTHKSVLVCEFKSGYQKSGRRRKLKSSKPNVGAA